MQKNERDELFDDASESYRNRKTCSSPASEISICDGIVMGIGNCYVAFFVDWNMFVNFTEHIDQHGKCKFVLASESGKFNEEGTGGEPAC